MPRVECPQCHAAAVLAGGKPYCARCGWNRDAVEKQLRGTARMWPWTSVIFLLLAAAWAGWFLRDWRAVLIAAGVPGAAFALVYIFIRRNLAKFLALKSEHASPAAAVEPALAASIAESETPPIEVSEQYRVLRSLPRPRPVRISRRGKTSTTLVTAIGIVFALVLLSNLYLAWIKSGRAFRFDRHTGILAGAALLILLILMTIPKGLAREKKLLANGEVTLARVVGQWQSRNGFSIRYEFRDPADKTVRNLASDYTRSLYEGMTVAVFYDAQKPSRQVAQCASLYEIVMPGKE